MTLFRKILIATAITLTLFTSAPQTTYAAKSVVAAKKYIGKNPTRQRYLWCADFINYIHRKIGKRTTGSRSSLSVFKLGKKISRKSARAGDIIYSRRRGGAGHVEFFVRWANKSKTKYVAITGNTCGKRGRRYVCQVTRSAKRIHSVVRPR